MAVVKANAYGHGDVPLAMAAVQQGVDWLAVGQCPEGVTLRQADIRIPILVLGPVWREDAESLVAYHLQSAIGSPEEAAWLQAEAARRGFCHRVHINVDTGMGRLGMPPAAVSALLQTLCQSPHLQVEGLMTHLATADTVDHTTVQEQLTRFGGVIQQLASQGQIPPSIHAANSAALYRYPQSHYTLVRAGIALYGSHPFDAPEAALLRPVLTWKTRLARVQEMAAGCGISYGHTFITRRRSRIGTLPVGYADGVCRQLSNAGEVLVQGQRVPIVGAVCMDLCMVDLTDIPSAQVGDEVVLIGDQGRERITADDMARRCGRIPYEIFCAIGPRVTRHYL